MEPYEHEPEQSAASAQPPDGQEPEQQPAVELQQEASQPTGGVAEGPEPAHTPQPGPTEERAQTEGPRPHERRVEIDVLEGDAVIRGASPQVVLSAPGVRADDHIVEDREGVLRFHRLPDDSELNVPDGTQVLVRVGYGDLRVLHLDGYVGVQRVNGDLDLDGVAVADVERVEGDLKAHHGGDLRVRAVGGDAQIVDYDAVPLVGHVGGDLDARDLAGLEVRGAAGGDITLDRCGEVRLIGTVGGDLKAARSTVALRASAVGGDVTLSSAQGVTLAAVGGDLSIEESAGPVEISSVGGDATLRRTRGPVRLGTVGGDLEVYDALGGLTAGRVGGDATIETALAPGADYNVNAGGDVSLRVRGDVNARFVAQTGGGEIRTRLPLSVERGRRRHLVGVLGRGDATVTLRSGGDITLTAADRFEEEQTMGDEFTNGDAAGRENEQGGPRTWETGFGRHRFRVHWDRQPGRASFRFRGPFVEEDDPDAMGGGAGRDWNFEWERGHGPRVSGEYQEQVNDFMEKVEKTARKAAEQAQAYAERAAKRARDTDWESIGREVRTAVERAMSEIENAFGQVRTEFERRTGPQQGEPNRPSGPQRVRIEMDDADAPGGGASATTQASSAATPLSQDEIDARRRAILEQLRNGTLSLDEAERQLNDLR